MKLSERLNIGDQFHLYDSEAAIYIKTRVIEKHENTMKFTYEDVRADFNGMTWEDDFEEIDTQYNLLNNRIITYDATTRDNSDR